MELFLLKVRHKWDREFEDCGIFSSREQMMEGKAEYLKYRKEAGLDPADYTFTHTTMILDKLY